jgi:hypothetical protein
VQAALSAQNGILDVSPAALNGTLSGIMNAIGQQGAKAAAQSLALETADTVGSPVVESSVEDQLNAKLGLDSQSGNSQSGNTQGGKHCPGGSF